MLVCCVNDMQKNGYCGINSIRGDQGCELIVKLLLVRCDTISLVTGLLQL